MSKLWYRTRGEDGASRLHEVNFSDFRVAGPTVIYLSGFLTTNGQPGFIAGALKRLEEMLGHRAPAVAHDATLYAWSHSSLANLFNMAAYNGFPSRAASRAGHVFARNLIMPLVAENLGWQGGRPKGRPLPADVIRQNLRHLTLLTYSAGTVTVQESFNAAHKMMRQIGMKDAEIRDLLGEVVVISTGNVSRPSKEKNRFTTLYLVASNDIVVRVKNALWAPLRTLLSKMMFDHPDALRAEKLSPASLLVTARVGHSDWEWRLDAGGKSFKSQIKRLMPAWTLVNSNHELPYYITHDEKLSPFANIALYGLTNAVGRTQKLDIERLVAAPATRPAAEAAAYTAKMAVARRMAPR
jgi:hypothetical protein